MLEIVVPASKATEFWDESTETFIKIPERREQVLHLEHSLIALSEWESKWCKPYLDKKEKTEEEVIDYIRCMTLNKNVDNEVYYRLSQKNFEDIEKYINSPATATTINRHGGGTTGGKRNRVITSELIYFWMISLNIPVEFRKWHLNRLMTLIEVCDIEGGSKDKMSKKATAQHYAAINAARRKKYNSKG